MYLDFDNGLARERAEHARAEVARNRREARLRRASRFDGSSDARGGRVARGAAKGAVLFSRIVQGF